MPFKGKSVHGTYNPKKPKKWGYKIFVLSGVDGLVHNLEVHTGKIESCPGQPDIKASGNIVFTVLDTSKCEAQDILRQLVQQHGSPHDIEQARYCLAYL